VRYRTLIARPIYAIVFSLTCPVGARGHRLVVTAAAGDTHDREEVAIEIASTTHEAWRRRGGRASPPLSLGRATVLRGRR